MSAKKSNKKISKRELVVSCGIVIVRPYKNEYQYLLLRSYSNWDFPKGRKEIGESDLETAIRETEEESAVPEDSLNFKWGKSFYETEPYRKRKDKVARYFIAETDFDEVYLPVNLEMGRPEHEEFRWMTYDEAMPKLKERLQKVLNWAKNKLDGEL